MSKLAYTRFHSSSAHLIFLPRMIVGNLLHLTHLPSAVHLCSPIMCVAKRHYSESGVFHRCRPLLMVDAKVPRQRKLGFIQRLLSFLQRSLSPSLRADNLQGSPKSGFIIRKGVKISMSLRFFASDDGSSLPGSFVIVQLHEGIALLVLIFTFSLTAS